MAGIALMPRLDISNEPRPERGSTLTVSFRWPGTPAKVVEQNMTSRLEGAISSVKGVEEVSSVSTFGAGRITIETKKGEDIAQIRFEITSLMRSISSGGKLPEGATYPVISGGEANAEQGDAGEVKLILAWQLHADMSDETLHKLAEENIKSRLERIDGVHHVEVTGKTKQYTELSYDADELAMHGLSANNLAEAVNECSSQNELMQMPVRNADGRIIHIDELATCSLRMQLPDSYFRINGENTIYVNVFADRGADIVSTASKVKEAWTAPHGVKCKISYDRAEEEMKEFKTLAWRSLLTLLLLLLFVWLSSGRKWN